MDKFLESIEKNKIAVMIIGALVVALVFVGVSNKDSSSSSTSMTDTIVPDAVDNYNSQTLVVSEAGYLRDVRSVGNYILNSSSDADVLDLGYSACDALDSGQTVSSMAIALGTQFAGEPETQEASFAVIAGAVIHLCPEYKYQADALGN